MATRPPNARRPSGHSLFNSSPELLSPEYRSFESPPMPVEMQQFPQPDQPVSHRRDTQPDLSPGSSFSHQGSASASPLLSKERDSSQSQFGQIPPALFANRRWHRKSEASLKSMDTMSTGYRSKHDSATYNLIERRALELAQWKIHMGVPTLMLSLFVLGVVGAIAHHLFYMALDGNLATDQLRMVRFGTALAFFTKATLVGSVVLSHRQRIWHDLRTKAMTIGAIDGLFSATEDLTGFLNWEMFRKAKLATLMAAATWLMPIAAVLSPAALTSELALATNATMCESIPTIDFSRESTYDFRDPDIVSNFPGYSIAFYNTTDVNGTEPGFFDYFDRPSKNARRLSITSAYLRRSVHADDAAIRSCGPGWNCTYTIEFTGPGYKCDPVLSGRQSDEAGEDDIAQDVAPFNVSSLAPVGNLIYLAEVDQGEYANPQLPTDDRGQPQQEPPWPENLGAFETEPVLWIGHSVNTDQDLPPSSPFAERWKTQRIPKIFKCEHYETHYQVKLNFTEGQQIYNVTNRTYLNPIVDTRLRTLENGLAVAEPTSNFVQPDGDVGRYKLTTVYHAMGMLLRNFLRGTISHDTKYPLTRSDISETRLIDQKSSYPVSNLQEQVQSLYEDMLITLLSEPHLMVASTTDVPCVKTRTLNVYRYRALSLWLGYAIIILFALVFLIVGGISIRQNGVTSDTTFSRIMVTTRNPTLDRLSVGACLGGDPFPTDLKKTTLRFGVLMEDDDGSGLGRDGLFGRVEHCAFGTEQETKPIERYGHYAGLKRWRRRLEGEGEDDDGPDERLPLLEEVDERRL